MCKVNFFTAFVIHAAWVTFRALRKPIVAERPADVQHTPPISPVRSIFLLQRSAIRFTTFERVSGWLQEDQGKVKAVNALAAGTVAGAVESATCLTPLQNIQIKMMQMNRCVGALGTIRKSSLEIEPERKR